MQGSSRVSDVNSPVFWHFFFCYIKSQIFFQFFVLINIAYPCIIQTWKKTHLDIGSLESCYYFIQKYLKLANSMISSRLDYFNSLLYDVSKYNVAKLQKIQNALCRIVFRLDRTSHVTPFLQKLHWLPITYRILFKYNLITFKAIKFSQPIYLSSLIKTSCLTCGNHLSLSSVSHKKAIVRQGGFPHRMEQTSTISTITTNNNFICLD